MDETKKCPRCAEEIKAEAKVCRFCKAQFKVGWRGYCSSCHEIVEGGKDDNCPKCGAELIDKSFTSELLEETAASPAAETPSAAVSSVPPAPAGPVPPPPPTAVPPVHAAVQPAAVPPPVPPGVASAAAAPPADAASAGYVKQGIGASLRQYVGMIAIDTGAFLLFISWFFGFATRNVGYLAEKTNGPVAFLIIPVILIIIAATLEQSPFFGSRYSKSNLRISGGLAKSFRASAKEIGFTTVFRQRLWPKVIALLLISLGTLGIWIYNYNDLSNQNVTFNTGAWIALVATILAVVGSLMLIPTSKNKQVVIDTGGIVHLLPPA